MPGLDDRAWDLVFGPEAQRLEARACPGPPGLGLGATAELSFSSAGLTPEELALLQHLRDARLEPAAPEGMARLLLPADLLEELGERSPGLACLAQAQRNATAPRARPRILGVLNVTPDSFSDGGRHSRPDRAISHGLKLIEEGADILDVGGESTRPGAEPVEASEELERVLGVVTALAADGRALVSIDTRKAIVARTAIDEGASMVNDVSAGTADPEMLASVARSEASMCLMHMRGTPSDMQSAPAYRDCVREVVAYLRERVAEALKASIPVSRILLDPGIGFGKRLEDNLALLRALPELRSLGLPLVLGVSRKSFLGLLGGEDRPHERTFETTAAVAIGALLGADVHRVHDVAGARRALAVAQAVARGAPTGGAH